MAKIESSEPLLGDELVRIVLETYGVELRFQRTNFQIWTRFLLRADGVVATLDPEVRAGDLSPLWNLIGKTISDVQWKDAICLTFDGGTMLEIPSTPGHPRGALLGGDDGVYGYEEF